MGWIRSYLRNATSGFVVAAPHRRFTPWGVTCVEAMTPICTHRARPSVRHRTDMSVDWNVLTLAKHPSAER